jgi:hypothetical protein
MGCSSGRHAGQISKSRSAVFIDVLLKFIQREKLRKQRIPLTDLQNPKRKPIWGLFICGTGIMYKNSLNFKKHCFIIPGVSVKAD